MNRKIYIAGPMTGKDNCNIEAFFRAARWLKNLTSLAGREVDFCDETIVNPAQEALEKGLDLSTKGNEIPFLKVIAGDLLRLKDCTDIVFLPGWESSPGCLIEHLGAKRNGNIIQWEFIINSYSGKPADILPMLEPHISIG